VKVLCGTPPLTLPFITIGRRLWATLRLVINIAMKWRVMVEAIVLVIDILGVLFCDNVIHNFPPCIQIMIFIIEICHISQHTFPIHLLSIPTHVGIIPCCVLTTPAYDVLIPSCVATTLTHVMMIPSRISSTRIHVRASASVANPCRVACSL
jgi:hypothetical protein